ncbi:hypothetical protein DFH09DRAFT_1332389 [Mycena vulgaris]|nr:hypothetical protein DFH09DRAFT_1332389 [Mycena vulgaris]
MSYSPGLCPDGLQDMEHAHGPFCFTRVVRNRSACAHPLLPSPFLHHQHTSTNTASVPRDPAPAPRGKAPAPSLGACQRPPHPPPCPTSPELHVCPVHEPIHAALVDLGRSVGVGDPVRVHERDELVRAVQLPSNVPPDPVTSPPALPTGGPPPDPNTNSGLQSSAQLYYASLSLFPH